MNNAAGLSTWCTGLASCALVLGSVLPSLGQSGPADLGGYRKLAPGVMQSIDPAEKVRESFSRHDVVELLAIDPNLDQAKKVPFRHDIWYLEFQFKPVRMIRVDVPQASGRMRQKLIWYMVYRVANHGKAMHPVQDANGSYKIDFVDKPVRFVPDFLLESPEFDKWYPDRVIPIAIGPIGRREDSRRKFRTSVSISEAELKVGETAWGIATWEDLDPRIDRFSIYVKGLTNAYRWTDQPGAYQPGAPIGKGRQLKRKTLKLNFWRPGDEYFENEGEIRYGIPGEVDYEWVYR